MASNNQVSMPAAASASTTVAAAAAAAGEGRDQQLKAADAYVKQFLAEQQLQQHVQQQPLSSPGEPVASAPSGSGPPPPCHIQRQLQPQPPPPLSNAQLLNQYLGLSLSVPSGAAIGTPHRHQDHLQQHHLFQQQQHQQHQAAGVGVGGVGLPPPASSALFLPPQLTLLLADYLTQQQKQQHAYDGAGRLLLPLSSTLPPASLALPPPPAANTANSMLANLQQAHQAAATAVASPPVSNHHPVPSQTHHRQQQLHAPPPPPPQLAPHPADADAVAQQQHLLASALLLSSVNPGLAAAAMAQALTMQQPPPVAPPGPIDGAVAAASLTAPRRPGQHHLHHQAQALGQLQPLGNQQLHRQVQVQVQDLGSKADNDDHGAAVTVVGVNPSNRFTPVDSGSILATASPSGGGNIMVHANSNGTPEEIGDSSRNISSHKSATKKSTSSRSGNGNPHHPAAAAARRSSEHLPTRRLMSNATTTSSSSSLPQANSGSTLTALSSDVRGGGSRIANVAKGHIRGHPIPVAPSTVAGAAASSSAIIIPSIPLTTLQRWSLERLDAHVKQYRAANQSVPQSIALLVADVRRKEEKRHAKRLANRKSACTSRARKKALIDEMTRENARLRRQALILSYLPDPVVAIRADGVITFCSMQVERVLRYNASELLGANIEDIIVPSSRESIRRLISDLVVAEQRALLSASSMEEEEEEEIEDDDGEDMGNENISASTTAARPHEVSEHSSEKSSLPPLLEVKVTSESSNVAAGEDVSDSSGDDKKNKAGHQQQQQTNSKTSDTSSLTHKVSSLSEGAGLGSGEDQTNNVANATSSSSEVSSPLEKMITKEEKNSTEDESTSSENKANANLTKNVEMCKLNKDKGVDEQVRFSHKDDVMGASVTANNADAKLSSLMHHPKKEEVSGAALDVDGGIKLMSSGKQPEEEDQDEQVASMRQKCALLGLEGSSSKQDGTSSLSAGSSSLSKKKKQRGGNSSEDSGYRESNESPEESNDYLEDSLSSSEASVDRSSSKKKRRRTRPLAPACYVRLIRDDLSTIWCELTSSIRTRPSNDVDKELNIVSTSQLKTGEQKNSQHIGSNESAASSESAHEEKELLLCFRPIREGDAVGEELRFCPQIEKNDGSDGEASSEDRKVSSTTSTSSKNKSASNSVVIPSLEKTQAATSPPLSVASKKNRPPKKRKFESDDDSQGNCLEDIDEKSAVESMMELAKKHD